LTKRRRFTESWQCLQKALQITPDSWQTWCLCAGFAQWFLADAEHADQCLLKARHILDASRTRTPRDMAALEHCTGRVAQSRGDHNTAVEHMKKAYELDPRRYRRRRYAEALELAKAAQAWRVDAATGQSG